MNSPLSTVEHLEALFRRDYPALLAPLLRRCGGDFERAEEALSQAFTEALMRWPKTGLPASPAAWLAAVAKRRSIDVRRRGLREQRALDALASTGAEMETDRDSPGEPDSGADLLGLIFACCHPTLSEEAQVTLALNALCGLPALEIARAFLVSEVTVAQRLVRAKAKLRANGACVEAPAAERLAERLPAVLRVLYLLFNEGHAATRGEHWQRSELCEQALRLAAHLAERLPDQPEVEGLLALMELTHARRAARLDSSGFPVLLADQDRAVWDRAALERGRGRLAAALARRQVGPFQVQAAIAALHGSAPTAADTDWPQILELYRVLLALEPGPVVALNLCVALAEVAGPAAALEELERQGLSASLDGYLHLHSTKASLLARLDRPEEARRALRRALELADNRAERALLLGRLQALEPERGDDGGPREDPCP